MASRCFGFVVVTVLVCSVVSRAGASISLETSRAGLAGTDNLDWGDLGPSFAGVSNPFSIVSNNGRTVTVSQATGTFLRVDQNNGWAGNFAPGDRLLWTQAGGPVTIDFSFGSALEAFGLQIQGDYFGSFVAQLEAFDSGGASLGAVTENGFSSSDANNSAIFIGIKSDSTGTDFSKITISLTAGFVPTDFAVNQADFTPTSSTGAVPLPGAIIIWSLLCGMGSTRLGRSRPWLKSC